MVLDAFDQLALCRHFSFHVTRFVLTISYCQFHYTSVHLNWNRLTLFTLTVFSASHISCGQLYTDESVHTKIYPLVIVQIYVYVYVTMLAPWHRHCSYDVRIPSVNSAHYVYALETYVFGNRAWRIQYWTFFCYMRNQLRALR